MRDTMLSGLTSPEAISTRQKNVNANVMVLDEEDLIEAELEKQLLENADVDQEYYSG